jgi:hypothetical protein
MTMQLAIVIPISELGGLPGLGIGNQLPTGPVYPGHGLPGGPVYPSQGLPGEGGSGPRPGHDLPAPPVAHLPPQAGQLPIYPGTPSHPIAIPPGVVWPPLGPQVPQGKALAVIWIQGLGYRWTVIDTTLQIGGGPATPPLTPGQLPGQTPQPKTAY